MPLAAPDLLLAAARLRADADTLATAVERLAELQAVCRELHDWNATNQVGALPGLQSILTRLSAVLNT